MVIQNNDDDKATSMNPAQSWNPSSYSKNAGFVAELGLPVLQLLDPKPHQRILDLGCGDGVLTKKIADTGAMVMGIDSSPDQVAAAVTKGLDARLASGDSMTFVEEFDAVFSNAALHWILNIDAVIAGVWRALQPGGHFVGEFGGAGNVAQVEQGVKEALKSCSIDPEPLVPWYFPDSDEYGRCLQEGGFQVDHIELIERPTPLPGPLGDWLELFAQNFLNAVPGDEREALKADIAARLENDLCGDDGVWVVDYVRLRFKAIKLNGDGDD